MIMADVFAVFGTLLTVGIALPGLLLTWQLLFPKLVSRAERRIVQTPWKCFFLGGFLFGLYLVPVIVLFNLPWEGGPVFGLLALFGLMAFASFGGAGLATGLGHRLQKMGVQSSPAGATLRGAVALELAAIFPFMGWFIFIPITFIIALGAAFFALLNWIPRPKPVSPSAPQASQPTVEEASATA